MSDPLRRSFVLLTVTAAAMAALLAFLPAAGHDQLWFLLMAKRWLGGATLYGPEIFDSNPPLVIWLSAIPVRLAQAISFPATAVAKALVLLATGAVAWLSARVLSRVWQQSARSLRPALLLAFVTIFLVVPARDLGQRDALAALFALPYVLAAADRSRTVSRVRLERRYHVAAGLLAALGLCLKPQDALIAVAVEAWLLFNAFKGRRSLRSGVGLSIIRPEPIVLVLCGLLYLLAIHRFAPLYLTNALPIVRNTYWAIGHLSLPALLVEAIELTVLAAATLALLLRTAPVSRVVWMLFAGGVGAFSAYLLQGTGWYYQQLPAISLFGAALALHLLDLQQRHPLNPPRWLFPSLTVLCFLAVTLTTHFTGYPFTPDRSFAITSPDPAFFTGLAPGTPVAILTTSVDEAMMPVERFHLTWGQRTNNLWLLPAILRSEEPGPVQQPKRQLTPLTLARLSGMQHRWIVEDLTRWHPKLILVERCQDPQVRCQVLEDRHDDLLAWFQRDPAFADLWRQQYTFAGTRDRFDAYVLRGTTGASAPEN